MPTERHATWKTCLLKDMPTERHANWETCLLKDMPTERHAYWETSLPLMSLDSSCNLKKHDTLKAYISYIYGIVFNGARDSLANISIFIYTELNH